MQVKFKRHKFTEAFDRVKRTLGKDVLSNVFIEADSNTMTLTTADGSASTKCIIPCTTTTPGVAFLNNKIGDLIHSILDPEIEFRINAGSHSAQIDYSSGTTKISGLDPVLFPKIVSVINIINSFEISIHDLIILAEVREICQPDSSKPVYNTVNFEVAPSYIKTTAISPVSISKRILSHSSNKTMQGVVPVPMLKNIQQNLLQGTKPSDIIKVNFDVNRVQFVLPNKTEYTSLLYYQVNFPDTAPLFNKIANTVVEVDGPPLAGALNRISAMCKDARKPEANFVSVEVHKDKLVLIGSNLLTGEVKENIPAVVSGGGLNVRYKLDVLNQGLYYNETAFPSVRLHIQGADSPTIITPNGSNEFEYLLMPITTK